jgi:hypothetical protein
MDAMHYDMLCMVSYELGFLICLFYPHFLGFKDFLKNTSFICVFYPRLSRVLKSF